MHRLALAAVLALAACSQPARTPPASPASPASEPATAETASAAATTPAPAAAADPAATPPPKDPATGRTLIASGAVVIDVRTPDEYKAGHLPQAVNVPITELSTRLPEVEALVGGDKTKPIVTYCGRGGRAGKAKLVLDGAGYSRVVNGGGLDDLRDPAK